jgi:Rrf2 family nitric oxide-sensitive transcriptional repressor
VQLTQFSDYSLRLLLYLAAHPDRLVPIDEVSRAYGVSHHHLVKIVQLLVDRQLVASTRGRGGGLRLNRQPADINVGALVRITEPHFDLVECFDRTTNTCPSNQPAG